MKQIADNLFQIGTRGHNFYLIRDGDEGTLVDAGCSKEWKKLVSALDAANVQLESIRGVIATHAHADHFGLAAQLQNKGVDVSVHTDEESRAVGTYEGRFSASSKDVSFFNIHALRNMMPMVFAGVMSHDHVEAVGTFSDGERLDLPGHPTVVHTPGHTEGHAMFHCSDLGLLFTGDGLITMDLTGPAVGPQPIGKVFNLDHDQAIASLDRIVNLEADLLLPGHGQPWKGSPEEAVSLARA